MGGGGWDVLFDGEEGFAVVFFRMGDAEAEFDDSGLVGLGVGHYFGQCIEEGLTGFFVCGVQVADDYRRRHCGRCEEKYDQRDAMEENIRSVTDWFNRRR